MFLNNLDVLVSEIGMLHNLTKLFVFIYFVSCYAFLLISVCNWLIQNKNKNK